MTAPYNIVRWFAFSATIAPRTSYGARGSPVYGSGAAVACHIEQRKANVMGPDGNEMTSDTAVYVSPDVAVSPYDRVTLPDGTIRPVKAVEIVNAPIGQAALKVVRL